MSDFDMQPRVLSEAYSSSAEMEGTPHSPSPGRIPQNTLEILARNFFREASSYGFRQIDYLRFVNVLLGVSIEAEAQANRLEARELWERGAQIDTAEQDSQEGVLPISSERITIRAFEPERDLRMLELWLADEWGRHFLLSRSTARTMDCERLLTNPDHHVGIITLRDGLPVGAIAYLNHDREQHKAELRKLIGVASMRGFGLGKEASRLWIRYGALGLRLKKIYLDTLETNLHNIRINEDLGFKVEGILRNEILLDGQYRDVLRMGLWIG